jgi:Xaa-Pro aminopeptidase
MADKERRSRVAAALREAQLDALVCALPMNVLMMSGYWPVLGTAVAVFSADGRLGLAAPEGEEELAQAAWPAEIELFKSGSLERVNEGTRALEEALGRLLQRLDVSGTRIGIEDGAAEVPVGYSAVHIYSVLLPQVLSEVNPKWQMEPGDGCLQKLRALKTTREIEFIKAACETAQKGFEAAERAMVAGAREIDVALAARREFALPAANEGSHRADGFAWCMSGPNSAEAGYAFARSQARAIKNGDVVLLHANSYLDGYWTDITRTFVCGSGNAHEELFEAVAEARTAALAVIRPGIAAKEVDGAAREVLHRRGLSKFFTHGVGHEVGFGAVNADNQPRIHPASPDLLEEGMVFNVEPAVYLPGKVGLRHCDMVVVTADGCEVLTPWLSAVSPYATNRTQK